jgi:hypothetical protein
MGVAVTLETGKSLKIAALVGLAGVVESLGNYEIRMTNYE